MYIYIYIYYLFIYMYMYIYIYMFMFIYLFICLYDAHLSTAPLRLEVAQLALTWSQNGSASPYRGVFVCS